MSHMVFVDNVQITNIALLEQAAAKCGLVFKRNASRVKYFMGSTNCDHLIEIPNCDWGIGVNKVKHNPPTYTLSGDFYGETGEKVREMLHKVLQEYIAAETIDVYAEVPNADVSRIDNEDGSVELVVNVW